MRAGMAHLDPPMDHRTCTAPFATNAAGVKNSQSFWRATLSALAPDTRGATYVEWLVLLGVIGLGAMGSYRLLNDSVFDTSTQMEQSILTLTFNGNAEKSSGGIERFLSGSNGTGATTPWRDPDGSIEPVVPGTDRGLDGQTKNSLQPADPWPQSWDDSQRYDKILVDPKGLEKKALDAFPGGTKPTREELAQVDAIVRKYEAELAAHQGEPGFDQRELVRRMAQELAPIARQHRNDFTWFYYMVKTNSVLDLKNRSTDANGGQLWNENWTFGPYSNANGYSGDTAGNYLYGYVGSEVFGTGPLGQSVLKSAAGAAQVMDDGQGYGKYLKSWATGGWGDNPGDAAKVGLGVSDYQNDTNPNHITTVPSTPIPVPVVSVPITIPGIPISPGTVAVPIIPGLPVTPGIPVPRPYDSGDAMSPTNRDAELVAATASKQAKAGLEQAKDVAEGAVDLGKRAVKRAISGGLPIPILSW